MVVGDSPSQVGDLGAHRGLDQRTLGVVPGREFGERYGAVGGQDSGEHDGIGRGPGVQCVAAGAGVWPRLARAQVLVGGVGVRPIAEFDQLGRDAFLDLYGFGQSRIYFLVHEGRRGEEQRPALGASHGLHR